MLFGNVSLLSVVKASGVSTFIILPDEEATCLAIDRAQKDRLGIPEHLSSDVQGDQFCPYVSCNTHHTL